MSGRPTQPRDPFAPRRRALVASWLVDEVVVLLGGFVVGAAVGIGVRGAAPGSGTVRAADGDHTVLVAVLVAVALAPVVYGLLCVRGRTLGCLLVGTAFHSVRTGRRCSGWRMAWVCPTRAFLFPVAAVFGLLVLVTTVFDAEPPGSGDLPEVHVQRYLHPRG